MATVSHYEPSVAPAEFMATWHQTLDLRPGASSPKNSNLRSLNTIDMDNLPLEQDDKSQYGDEDCAATDALGKTAMAWSPDSVSNLYRIDNPTCPKCLWTPSSTSKKSICSQVIHS
jgi:hypothetical protein